MDRTKTQVGKHIAPPMGILDTPLELVRATQEGPYLSMPIPEGATYYQSEDISEDARVKFFTERYVDGELVMHEWGMDPSTHRPGWVPQDKRFRGPLLSIHPSREVAPKQLPFYDKDFYSIIRNDTDHPFKLIKWLLQERGVTVIPKYEVECACRVYFLLGHWNADPVNWHANAHKELEEYEAARCDADRRAGKLTEKDFEHYVVYESNKFLVHPEVYDRIEANYQRVLETLKRSPETSIADFTSPEWVARMFVTTGTFSLYSVDGDNRSNVANIVQRIDGTLLIESLKSCLSYTLLDEALSTIVTDPDFKD